jgi:hypothetical protein
MRVVLSGLAAFVTMFVAGGIWNAVLMASFYAERAPAIARPPEQQSMLRRFHGVPVLPELSEATARGRGAPVRRAVERPGEPPRAP